MNAKSLLPLLTALLIAPAAVPLLPTAPVCAQTSSTEAEATALLDEANRLLQQGIDQYYVSQFQEALQSWAQALELYQNPAVQAAFPQEGRQGEGNTLGNLGNAYNDLGQYREAIAHYEQSLVIFREIGSQWSEGNALSSLGTAYANLGQYREAIAHYEQSLVIFREIGDWQVEGMLLSNLGTVYNDLGQHQEAIARYEQSLIIFRQIGDRAGEGNALSNLGLAYNDLGQYQDAIVLFEQSLAIAREIGNRRGEGNALGNLGLAYNDLGQYQDAIALFEQQLIITREIGDRRGEGSALGSLGITYYNLGQYQDAIALYEQQLAITREIGDRAGEGNALNNLGIAYSDLGQYREAITFYEQQIVITREIGDRRGEGIALGNLGTAYRNLGQYQDAIALFEQSLVMAREVGNQQGEGIALGSLGIAYNDLGQYQDAIALFEQQLIITREIGDRRGEGSALGSLGITYYNLGQYQDAIALYEQQLAITREIGDRAGEGNALNNLGIAYSDLGQYREAITFYEQQIVITREIGDRRGEGIALGNLGTAYRNLGQYQDAIALFEQSLVMAREVGNQQGEGIALGSLGIAYNDLGQYQDAIALFEQQLIITREIGDRRGEGIALGNLGIAYDVLGQSEQALEQYQQALTITQDIDDRDGEGTHLSNMGALLSEQDQPELAIVFYKQSVNVRESIRDDIRGLPQEQQQSFTDTIAGSYRALADLLLQQNRVLEAQRVLDLLRVQELDDYLDGVRSNSNTERGIGLRDPEQEINNRVIAVGYELAQLRDIPPNQLTDAQLQRLGELDTTQRELSADFQGFLNSPEIKALVAQLDVSLQEQDILARADEFINLQNNLRDINQNAVMIYPLILEDRLELVLVTPFSEPARYPVDVDSAELNAAILEFRQALTDRASNPQPIAQQLYDWLIAPMQADLDAIGAETILYAPDGALRYVPLAALHNGDQWLIETYRINHITAASLQNFNLRPTATPIILAAAFSDGFHEFEVGQRSFAFDGLPFAGVEVENLVAAFPNTTQFMNDRFSRALVEPLMDSHTIVHLATHASFVPDSPAESFILFGNGDRLTLQELNTPEWRGRFNNVELVVLSACETGVGGDRLGNGAEILGFGYLMQEAGAVAAIASLWQVSDGGTQVLMDGFYAALNNGYSKAEALQRAQQALITSDALVLAGDRGNPATIEIVDSRTGQPLSQSADLAHPYYWAPFILIGNGL
ncbi:MAG: tetratricopeptide repeat protein [Synechococcales cyanobacterium K44_A2020_017]|nr:tetratricopeptide repeat protein [Synechococcales cyanobacterium K32_A2020_035]MBF2095867.1 tetratricopeptide repeat protein [Synechococcales cyanobacterium K44_A2020_017]